MWGLGESFELPKGKGWVILKSLQQLNYTPIPFPSSVFHFQAILATTSKRKITKRF